MMCVGRATAALGVWAGLLTACSTSDSGGHVSLVTTVDTVDGIVRVVNSGAGPEWTLEQLVDIGAQGRLGEAQPDEFGRVYGVVADDEGFIYVADALAQEIRVFNPRGQFVRRIGRQGGGPLEFERLNSIGLMDNTIVALDPGNGRIALVNTDGTWAGQRPYAALSGSALRVFQTGGSEVYTPALQFTEEHRGLVFVRHTPEAAQDTVPFSSAETDGRKMVTCEISGGGISFFAPEWAPGRIRVPAPGLQVAEVWTGDYSIAFLDPAGDTTRLVSRDLARVVPSDEEWREQLAAFDSLVSSLPNPQCDPRRPERPEVKARIRAVFFDDLGRMWVEHLAGDRYMLDAFDDSGALRGTVALPERQELLPIFIRNERLYLVAADSLGVEHVVAFQVVISGG